MRFDTAESEVIIKFAEVYKDTKAALLKAIAEGTAQQAEAVLAQVEPPLVINAQDLLRSNFFDQLGERTGSIQIAFYMKYVRLLLECRPPIIFKKREWSQEENGKVIRPPEREKVLEAILPDDRTLPGSHRENFPQRYGEDELLRLVSHLPDEEFNGLIAEIILDLLRKKGDFPQLKKVVRIGTKTILNGRVKTSGCFAIHFDELSGVLTLTLKPLKRDQFSGDMVDEVKRHWELFKKAILGYGFTIKVSNNHRLWQEMRMDDSFFEGLIISLHIRNLREVAFKFLFPNNRLDAVLKALNDPEDLNHEAVRDLDEEKIWVLAMGLEPRPEKKASTSAALASKTEWWDSFPRVRDGVSQAATQAFVRREMSTPTQEHPQAVRAFLGNIERRLPQSGWTGWAGRVYVRFRTPWKVTGEGTDHAQTVHQFLLDLAGLDSAIAAAEKAVLSREIVTHLKASANAARAALPAWLKLIDFAMGIPEIAAQSSFDEFPALLKDMMANALNPAAAEATITCTAHDHELKLCAVRQVEAITETASRLLHPNPNQTNDSTQS